MIEKYNSIMKNDVWEIVPRLAGKLVFDSSWLCKVNYVASDSAEKCKVGLVVRGFF
jgi:hypothetical protein